MALHVCRDFAAQPFLGGLGDLCLYYLAMFTRVCLGYTVVGQISFDIDGSDLRIAHGTSGALNMGPGDERMFQPDGHAVSADDVGRILVLRSPANGMVNSGLFRVIGIDVGRNMLNINYRSTDVPPAEVGMSWGLYANELTFINTVSNDNGGGTGYTGWTINSPQTRIILRSPSPVGWQVRLTVENVDDYFTNGGPVTVLDTVAPGFNGDSNGDFSPGGDHLHGGLFFNRASDKFAGTTVGWTGGLPQGVTAGRIYIWGSDVTGNVVAVSRCTFPDTSSGNSWCMFGIPDDEEQPLPPRSIHRLFVMGANGVANNSQNGTYWASGPQQDFARGGVAFGLCNQPISCLFSTYGFIFGTTSTTKVRNDQTAGDNPYLNATELVPVDLVAGTYDQMRDHAVTSNVGSEYLVSEVRRMGRAPFVRLGRANYGYFQITNDQTHSWLHVSDGIYLPWKGSSLP